MKYSNKGIRRIVVLQAWSKVSFNQYRNGDLKKYVPNFFNDLMHILQTRTDWKRKKKHFEPSDQICIVI